jgi:hypothetical protein
LLNDATDDSAKFHDAAQNVEARRLTPDPPQEREKDPLPGFISQSLLLFAWGKKICEAENASST